MEKFSPYILGMKNVIIETDHRPLVTLFGDIFLDRLSPRIQGFKLRFQKFHYTIRHVSGSKNVAADALSRYNTAEANEIDTAREREIELYIDNIYQHGSDSRLEQFCLKQHEDEILSM